MKRNCKSCIWYEDCKAAGDIRANCDDFSPVDESEMVENQYIDSLKRRGAAYGKVIKEFNN